MGGYQFTECKGKPEAKPELDFSIISGIPDAERVLAEAEVVQMRFVIHAIWSTARQFSDSKRYG